MSIFNMPVPSAFGQNVKPFDGALLHFYEVGSTTPKNSYSDVGETTANTNPVVADANGRFDAIYISGLYKAVLKDKNEVQIWEEDNLQGRQGDLIWQGDFDATTNGGDYPASGNQGDIYICTTGFTLDALSGSHILQTGDFIISNKTGATGIDADWDIIRGVVPNRGAVALSDGANIATDCSAGTVFTITLGGNRTLDNPTNKIIGQKYTWVITQDGTGSRTLAFGTDFDILNGGLVDPTIAAVTVINGVVISATSIRCTMSTTPNIVVASGKGLDFSADTKGIFKGLEAIVYRLKTSVSGSDDPLGLSGGEWEPADDVSNEGFLGANSTTLVSESTGYFTFQQTGYIFIAVMVRSYDSGHDGTSTINLLSDPGTTVFVQVAASSMINANSVVAGGYATHTCFALLKVETGANPNRVKIKADAHSATTTFAGADAENITAIAFIKLADI